MSGAKWTSEQLEAAVAGFVSTESLKRLKRGGMKEVQVITRSDLMSALRSLLEAAPESQGSTKSSKPAEKRIELLLIEIERLRREKREVEHQRGLLETERADLRGKLEAIGAAGSKAFGEKVTADDVRGVIEELEASREEVAQLKTQQEIARNSYEEQITGLRVKISGLEQIRDSLEDQLAEAQQTIETLKKELEAARSGATAHARAKSELEAKVTELEAELAAKTKELDELKNPPQEEEPKAEASEPQPTRTGTRRMRRSTRATPARRNTASGTYSFNFNASRIPGTGKGRRRQQRF